MELPIEADFDYVRGDTWAVTFPLRDDQKQAITNMEDTNLYFTVKENSNETNYLFQKTLNDGTIIQDENEFTVIVYPEDTDNLDYGTYGYDFSIVSNDKKYKQTLVRGKITLTEEYTFAVNE